ncbi:hypothetical protein ACLOJK_011234 [Asimina triloba]
MTTPFPAPVSAVQVTELRTNDYVGSYFVGQYYHVLQQTPDCVHHFYTDSSTILRVDGNLSDTATGMLQIHQLVMSLNFTGIEIKTAHSLDSWNGGVLVMVYGSVQTKDSNSRRKFVQTFFLAPQEKGYYVLNDIFHFLEDEQILQNPAVILTHGNYESNPNASTAIPEPVSFIRYFKLTLLELDNIQLMADAVCAQWNAVPDYTVGEIEAQEFVASPNVEENDTVDKYSIPEFQEQVTEAENVVEEAPVEAPVAPSYPVTLDSVRDPPPVPVEEPLGEPPKPTYASILRVTAKAQFAPSAAPLAPANKSVAPTAALDHQHHVPQLAPQQSLPVSLVGPDRSGVETVEEITTPEDEGESRSVYVRNLPSTVSASDIEQEFKNFGRIKYQGVVVRNRKDIGVCYAFVEFEDLLGVQNAVKASPIQFAGRQVHIEERRANSGRGRGRGSYQSESSRGRFSGRTLGRGNGQDGSDRDYSSRPRGNGFHQRGLRQERGIIGNLSLRNGADSSEA